MGEAYIALVGKILTCAARGESWEGAGSVGQDTRGYCAQYCTTLLYYCIIVLLYDFTIVNAHLHTCTLLQDTVHTIAGRGVLLLYSMAHLHFIALLCCVKGSRGS